MCCVWNPALPPFSFPVIQYSAVWGLFALSCHQRDLSVLSQSKTGSEKLHLLKASEGKQHQSVADFYFINFVFMLFFQSSLLGHHVLALKLNPALHLVVCFLVVFFFFFCRTPSNYFWSSVCLTNNIILVCWWKTYILNFFVDQVRLHRDPRWDVRSSRCFGSTLQQHRPSADHLVRTLASDQIRIGLRPSGGGFLPALRDLQNRWGDQEQQTKLKHFWRVPRRLLPETLTSVCNNLKKIKCCKV